MSHTGAVAPRQRTPYIRWERSLEQGTEIIGAMQQELQNLGVKLLDIKPSDTATVSIATAPNFKNAARDLGVDLDYPQLATRFLRSTDRSAIKRTIASSADIGFIKGRISPGRDSDGLRIVMNFRSQTMQDECTGINKLLNRKPFKGDVHISVANVHTYSEAEQLEIIQCLSGLMVGETFRFDPVMQKSVDAAGATSMRSLESLERQYYWQRATGLLVPRVIYALRHQ